jgi:eukaryotic-like serine/threonine-protein kinase
MSHPREPDERDEAEEAAWREAGDSAVVPPVRQSLRSLVLLLVLAFIAFATGLVLFNNLVMPQFIHGTGDVKVPDLANLNEEQAEQTLAPLQLKLSRAGERFDPSVPRGFILAQDPPPLTPVRGRNRVMVTVSLGEEFSSVPELFGESIRGARLLIDRAGLSVGGITRAPSDDVGEGLVAGSDPPAESVLSRDSPVSLLVSTGGGAESYVMPDLLGRDVRSVRRQEEAIGLRVLTPEGAGSGGIVIFQNPSAGSRIDRGATLTLQGTGRSQ